MTRQVKKYLILIGGAVAMYYVKQYMDKKLMADMTILQAQKAKQGYNKSERVENLYNQRTPTDTMILKNQKGEVIGIFNK